MSKNGGIIGVSDHGGWEVLVTVEPDGTLLDRRIELVDAGLLKLPHHHEGQGLPLDKAVELVERVRVSAERHAVPALDARWRFRVSSASRLASAHSFHSRLPDESRTTVCRMSPTG